MKINLENKIKHAVQEKVVPADKARSNDTIEEDIIECTICADPIPNYEPSLFNGVEINPACDLCNPPSPSQSENLPNLTGADLERKYKKEDLKPKERIRLKVQNKLKVRFENAEISREELKELEEELVKDLEEELIINLGKEVEAFTEKIYANS